MKQAIIMGLAAVIGGCLLGVPALAQQTPDAVATHTDADLYAQAGQKQGAQDYTGAIEIYRKIVAKNPQADRAWYNLALSLYGAKRYEEAIPAYQKAGVLRATRPCNASYDIACCYALMGKKAEALQWLDRSLKEGFPRLDHVRADEDLKILHDAPKFRELAGTADTSKMSRDEGWRYDLKLLARELKRVHYNPFTRVSREDFDRFVNKLHTDIPRLSDAQVIVGFRKLMAMAGDGHTMVGNVPQQKSIPLQFYLFEEGLFVIAAAPAYAELVGAEVVRVGTTPVPQVITALGPIISRDNDEWIKLIGPAILRAPLTLNGLGLIPTADKVALTVRDAKGQTREVVVPVPVGDVSEAERRGPGPDWASVLSDKPEAGPLYLKKRQTPYWYEYLPESKTVFFQYNAVQNDASEPLTAFCDRLFQFINDNPVERLVIDMRWNGGGNNFLNRPIVHGLIRCDKINQHGKLFVIVGRNTFSAAMCGATEIQRHTNALFVGEPTGSCPNFVGETGIQTLPYSKIQVSISFLYWQNSVAMDYRQAIVPEIYAPPTFADYKTGKDPALSAILDGAKPVTVSQGDSP